MAIGLLIAAMYPTAVLPQVEREEVAPDLFAEAEAPDDGQHRQRGAVQAEPLRERLSWRGRGFGGHGRKLTN